jgi:hypothetical protein
MNCLTQIVTYRHRTTHEMSSDDDYDRAKKRRVLRACDACRKRKSVYTRTVLRGTH